MAIPRRYSAILMLPLALLVSVASSGCTPTPVRQDAIDSVNVLYIYDDGTMKLNDRHVDPEQVVIYRDGFGGERAALKMRVPLHPDYYRDTIIVEREAGEAASARD